MADILKSFIALNEMERKFVIGDILESPKGLKEALLVLLKNNDEPAKEAFYKSLPAGWGGYISESVKGEINVSAEKLERKLNTIEKMIDNIPKKIERAEKITAKAKKKMLQFRDILRSDFAKKDNVISDQMRGADRGPLQKEYPKDCQVVDLPKPDKAVISKSNIFDCVADRGSHRKYEEQALSLKELSYLLWATQGIRKTRNSFVAFRTVPSAGCMHPFETYLAVNNVSGLERGMYLYLPVDHKLVKLFEEKQMEKKLAKAALGQDFVGNCAVTFIWSVVPYKTEWRYTIESKKIILLDAGHVCQNLYLACESIGCGTCAIAAYSQKLFDKLCRLDGQDEFVIYVSPVGKV